jgi:hypothetical protein
MDIIKHKILPILVYQVDEVLLKNQFKKLERVVTKDSQKIIKKHSAIQGDSISSSIFGSDIQHDLKNKNNVSCFLTHFLLNNIKKKFIELSSTYAKEFGFTFYGHMLNSWFNIQKEGSILNKHNHPLSTISAAYYLKADENSSPICFYNPNPFIKFSEITGPGTEYSSEGILFKPKTNSMFLFPSWLSHGSYNIKNKSKERIVISFNCI